jgi:hypothetical protein
MESEEFLTFRVTVDFGDADLQQKCGPVAGVSAE